VSSAVGAANSSCATTNEDPHLQTFDGTRFDFQAAGEFVLTRASAGDLEIQVRKQCFPAAALCRLTPPRRWRSPGTASAFTTHQTGRRFTSTGRYENGPLDHSEVDR
jgi:hypothetical protein